MSGTNQFQPFAKSGTANVLDPTTYAGKIALLAEGFKSGVAKSEEVNTPIRQATFVAAAMAQIIADTNVDALDDGDLAGFVADFLTALWKSGTTAAQFDNSTKVATMEALTRMGMQSSAFTLYSANATLTKADVGSTVQIGNNTGPVTLILPLTTDIAPARGRIELVNSGTYPVVIKRQGTTDILSHINAVQTTVSGITMLPGDSMTVVCQGPGIWLVVGGSADLDYSKKFDFLIGNDGYMRHPSGLIVQWGMTSVAVAANTATADNWTFPIAFPTACLQAFATPVNYIDSTRTAEGFTTTAATGFAKNSSALTLSTRHLAIGY